MIFAQTWQKVLDGSKTQTRRLKRGPYKVGGVYAAQPGRGKKAVGRIWMRGIKLQRLRDMSEAEIKAEGFETFGQFFNAFCNSYGMLRFDLDQDVWAFEFERMKGER